MHENILKTIILISQKHFLRPLCNTKGKTLFISYLKH